MTAQQRRQLEALAAREYRHKLLGKQGSTDLRGAVMRVLDKQQQDAARRAEMHLQGRVATVLRSNVSQTLKLSNDQLRSILRVTEQRITKQSQPTEVLSRLLSLPPERVATIRKLYKDAPRAPAGRIRRAPVVRMTDVEEWDSVLTTILSEQQLRSLTEHMGKVPAFLPN